MERKTRLTSKLSLKFKSNSVSIPEIRDENTAVANNFSKTNIGGKIKLNKRGCHEFIHW